MMRRYCVNISDEAAAVWFAHQVRTKIRNKKQLNKR